MNNKNKSYEKKSTYQFTEVGLTVNPETKKVEISEESFIDSVKDSFSIYVNRINR